jgi:CBS domain-containing protein
LVHGAPLFPVSTHAALGIAAAGSAVVVGVAGGALAWLMTRCVYGAEDLFGRLRVHWMWWPAIGGLVVGLGGLIEPRALGVGYATIDAELAGRLALVTLLVLLVVKLAIWSVALGSNTSGGILAPLLMLGAALGGILGSALPGASEGTWAIVGMAAALAGVTRSPLTSIVFALELTYDLRVMLALLIACTLAHLISVLTLRRSILTEKVARRGFHVTRDYEIDPLQALLARDVMQSDVFTLTPDTSVADAYAALPEGSERRRQRLYPVIAPDGQLRGVVAFSDLLSNGAPPLDTEVGELARRPLVVFPEETLRQVADRMLASGHGVLPVVEREDPAALAGLISQTDLLRAHERVLIEERHRERPLKPRRLTHALGGLLATGRSEL